MQADTPNTDIPLVLDIDGTLLKNDLTHELILRGTFKRPWKIYTIIKLALTSKPALKLWLVEQGGADICPETLPYHDEIITLAKAAKGQMREVILCSGSQERLVSPLVDHLDWVDAGFGTTPTYNMTSENKAAFLQNRYPLGFDYAGNSSQDFAVWKTARKGYAVEPPKAAGTLRSQNGETVDILKPRHFPLKALLISMRLHVFFLLCTAMQSFQIFHHGLSWRLVLTGLYSLLFCSSLSLVRDILCIQRDRRKSRKGTPLSRGQLSLPVALIACLLCVILTKAMSIANLF